MSSPDYAYGPRGLVRALKGDSNVNDIDAGFLAMATDIETKMANYSSGLASAMGAAGTEGRLYRQTDTGQMFFDDGAVWRQVPLVGTWQALTFPAGFAASTSVPQARRVGDEVRLRGTVRNTSAGTLAPAGTFAIVPASMRPAQVSGGIVLDVAAGRVVADASVDTSGNVKTGESITMTGTDDVVILDGFTYPLS